MYFFLKKETPLNLHTKCVNFVKFKVAPGKVNLVGEY